MTDYRNMDNFEINQRVANHTMDGEWFLPVGHPENNTDDILTNGVVWGYPLPDYCNSWADAGPIIASNSISLVNWEGGSWIASSSAYWVDGVEWHIDGVENDNPLRAAMIAFLMMKDAEV